MEKGAIMKPPTPQHKQGKGSEDRAVYLLLSELGKLDMWGRELKYILHTDIEQYGVFLVGSALKRKDYRDVDIRHIISNDSFLKMFSSIDIGYFNQMVSLWGQQVTGLPIDYQVQSIDSEDNKVPGYKHPIGINKEITTHHLPSIRKEDR